MGKAGLPIYGEDLGSAIETAEKTLAKIKTNKFDKQELSKLCVDLENVITTIENYIDDDED